MIRVVTAGRRAKRSRICVSLGAVEDPTVDRTPSAFISLCTVSKGGFAPGALEPGKNAIDHQLAIVSRNPVRFECRAIAIALEQKQRTGVIDVMKHLIAESAWLGERPQAQLGSQPEHIAERFLAHLPPADRDDLFRQTRCSSASAPGTPRAPRHGSSAARNCGVLRKPLHAIFLSAATSSLASGPADAGFWPVMRRPSTITRGCQLAADEYSAPSALSASSSS